MENTQNIERTKTPDTISSEKVDGTAVYGRDGDQIGSVHHLMIGKLDGMVRHAIVSFGGFLGMGEDYFPLPWNELSYNEARGGYVVSRDVEQLKNGPRYQRGQEPSWDRSYDEQLMGYYGRH